MYKYKYVQTNLCNDSGYVVIYHSVCDSTFYLK